MVESATEVIRLKFEREPQTHSLYDWFIGEALVPDDDILRKMRELLDFSFIPVVTAKLYHPRLGRPARDPEVLFRLLFLQVHYGLSDREVLSFARQHHGFRLFLGIDWDFVLPAASTLSRFRDRLGVEHMNEIFVHVLRQAQELELLTGERVLIDSTSVRGDTSVPNFRRLIEQVVGKALEALRDEPVEFEYLYSEYAQLKADHSYQESRRLYAELIAEWLSLAELVHESLQGLTGRGEVQQERLDLLNKVLERAANYGKRVERRDDLISAVDPDVRWDRKRRGTQTQPGYLEQLAVDDEHGIVTHVEVTPGNTDDSGMLQAMVEGHTRNVGLKPNEVVADTNYQSGENRAHLVERNITDHIAVPSPKGSKQGNFSVSDFVIEWNARGEPVAMLCPHGELAERPKWKQKKHAWVFYFRKGQCEGCPLRAQCSTAKRGRSVSVDKHYLLGEAARARQATEEGQRVQRERFRIERQFALQKQRGGGRTPYRGLARNQARGRMRGLHLNCMTIFRCLLQGLVGAAGPPGAKLYSAVAG